MTGRWGSTPHLFQLEPSGTSWERVVAPLESRQSAGTTEPGSWAEQSASISILVITK
jgi:hypothetical protein